MAAPTVTNIFVDATTASASAVNANFTDIINALTDGSSDLTFGNLVAQGTAALNGNITFGNATTDTITYTGRVASDIDPTTAATYVLGSDTLPWAAIYLDNTTTDGGAIYFDAGTTEYLKSNAAGTQLDIGSFTALNFTTTSTATIGTNSGGSIYMTDNDYVGIAVAPSVGRFDVKSAGTDTWIFAALSSDSAQLGGLYEEADTSVSLYLKNASAITTIKLAADGTSDSYVNSGDFGFGMTNPSRIVDVTGDFRKAGNGAFEVSTGTTVTQGAFTWSDTNGTRMFSEVVNSITAGSSGTACIWRINKDGSTSRSINAAGTLNASGADYAEYIEKAIHEVNIDKGELCGIDSYGKLTNEYDLAISFVVKSTDPAYVGGDKWSPDDIDDDLQLIKSRSNALKEEKKISDQLLEKEKLLEADYQKVLKIRSKRLEEARVKYDRIAFCGQVPCIVDGAFEPGDWVIPSRKDDGSIKAIAVKRNELTFDLYKIAVGQIWATYKPKEHKISAPKANALIAVGIK